MATRTVAGVVWMLGGVLLFPAQASSSTESRALTRQGYHHAYELRFDESLVVLAEAVRADPSDPAPLRAIAAVTWMEILFAQGVTTYAAFQGSSSADVVTRPPAPRHLAERFAANIAQALELAERRADSTPDDLDAQYELGATWGLQALYRGTVEGRAMAAFLDGRRAVATMLRITRRDPTRAEAALIPGIYRYAVSTLPWHKRMIATVAGMPGDSDGGIRLLERAASASAGTATDAALVLMTIYNREGRHGDAMRHLRHLVGRYPGNRLLRLNLAMTALDAGDPAVAVSIAGDLPGPADLACPPAAGERALWSYVRGAARAAQGHSGAEADLDDAMRPDSRDWIRARAHVERAKLAFRAGDGARGQAELDTAFHFGRRANDDTAIAAAERLRRNHQYERAQRED